MFRVGLFQRVSLCARNMSNPYSVLFPLLPLLYTLNSMNGCLSLIGLPLKKYYRLGDLKYRSWFPHNSGDWKSVIRFPIWSVCGEIPPLDWHKAFLLCSHVTERKKTISLGSLLIMRVPLSWSPLNL